MLPSFFFNAPPSGWRLSRQIGNRMDDSQVQIFVQTGPFTTPSVIKLHDLGSRSGQSDLNTYLVQSR